MRKVVFTLFMAIAMSTLQAQNVGIGTSTPAARLDVKANSNYVGQFNGLSPMYIGIFENDVYRGYWGSYAGNSEDVDFGTGSGNNTGKLHFTIQASPKLTINSSGQVGVGTINPSHLLHVNGGDLFVNSSSGSIRYGFAGGNEWQMSTIGGGADLRWFTTTDGGTTSTPRHYFSQNGNVGIGGFSGPGVPQARLDVLGSSTFSSTSNLMLRNSNGDTLLRMRDDGRMGIGYNGSSYGRTMNLGGSGLNFYTANEAAFGGAIFPTDTSLVLWSNSNANNYLVLQPSWGNTGVGTYTPNAKLHINGTVLVGGNSINVPAGYSMAIDGKVICEEVKVQLSTAWPDYVFADDYQLPSLESIEAHIKAKKHLPGIPSAAQVEADGITLGDMNKRLLEKIEQLTLHLIDLKKENQQLNNRLEKLEKKN
jgi:hypothetical protein